MTNLAVIVDANDAVIGAKDRSEIVPGDIFRITTVWIENSKGEVLLARRSLQKKHDPGLWGPAAAGTVEPGETYESNAYKELEEEIGLRNIELIPIIKQFWDRPDGTSRFAMMYRAVVDKSAEEFVLQEEEVASVAWVDKAWLFKDVHLHPEKYVPSASMWTKTYNE